MSPSSFPNDGDSSQPSAIQKYSTHSSDHTKATTGLAQPRQQSRRRNRKSTRLGLVSPTGSHVSSEPLCHQQRLYRTDVLPRQRNSDHRHQQRRNPNNRSSPGSRTRDGTMTLPITIPLWPDESVDSWIETLAHLNACAPRHIVTQASLNNGGNASPLTRSLRVETAQLLEVATGVDHTKIMNATLNRYQEVGLRPVAGQRIAEGTWATYPGTKYCPQCLTERQLRWKLS